jgi:hypothetical protein
MSLLCWNCRGLGQPRIVQELVRLVRELSPKIVFISETRQQATRVNNLKNRLAMDNCFLVDGKGKGGGLALYWDNSIKFSIVSYTMHHIDTLIWDGDHHASWRGTFAYGEPRVQDRHKLWKLLERLKPCSSASWLVIGDFNKVMWNFEHFSARRNPAIQMQDFLEVLSHCDLHDLGYSGLPWTYDNKQAGDCNVRVRLDRAVATPSWAEWFPKVHTQHLISASSDHCPVSLDLEHDHDAHTKQKTMIYEVMWEREESMF